MQTRTATTIRNLRVNEDGTMVILPGGGTKRLRPSVAGASSQLAVGARVAVKASASQPRVALRWDGRHPYRPRARPGGAGPVWQVWAESVEGGGSFPEEIVR